MEYNPAKNDKRILEILDKKEKEKRKDEEETCNKRSYDDNDSRTVKRMWKQ